MGPVELIAPFGDLPLKSLGKVSPPGFEEREHGVISRAAPALLASRGLRSA